MVIVILILLGLCGGSFAEATTWRIHQQAQRQKQGKKVDPQLSITKGRSMCANCGHTLAAKDLIPLFSWLSLAGKCRYCHKPIGWQAPVLEVGMAAAFVGSYIWWPYGFSHSGVFQFAVWLMILVLLIALAVYDLRWMLLPDRLIAPAAVLVVLQLFVLAAWRQDVQLLWGAVFGLIFLAGLFYLLFQVSDGSWIGGGDVKLGVPLGLLVGGPLNAILVLFGASILGLFVTLPLLVMKKKHLSSRVPFGPFLIAAAILVYLFGSSLINWYRQHLLLG